MNTQLDAQLMLALGEQLISAALNRKTALVQDLLDKGANVNIRDHDGMTALMWAKRIKYLPGIDLLEQRKDRFYSLSKFTLWWLGLIGAVIAGVASGLIVLYFQK